MKTTFKARIQLAVIVAIAICGFAFFKAPAVSAQSETGSITINTTSNPAGTADFFYFGGLGSFFLSDGQSRQENRTPGSYQIYQSRPDNGWVIDVTCTGGDVVIGNGDVIVNLQAGDDVVCNFHNTDLGGSITVVTSSDPAGATGFFYFGGVGSFTQDDGQSRVADNLLPGSYQIYQSVPAGWTVNISCTGADVTVGNGNVIVQLDANENAVCTFNNEDLAASVTLVTNSTPAGASFVYFGDLGFFEQADGASRESAGLLPGTRTVYQSVPAGWELDIVCTGGSNVVIGNGQVTINLQANEDVVCTFNNNYVGGSITLVTATDPAGATGFVYWGNLGFFSQDDGAAAERPDLYPGNYEVFQGVPQGWLLDINCTGGDVTLGDGNVVIHLDANENIVCTFNNTYVGGSITIVNETNAATNPEMFYFGNLGVFFLSDGQTEQRVDLYPGTYDVIQGVPFGWTLNISCTGGSTGAISTGVSINLGAREDIVCTFVNSDGTVTPEPEDAPFCYGAEATIWVNSLGIIVGGPNAGQAYAGVLHGTANDDVMVGTANADTIYGYDGRDMVCGGDGNDTIDGGDGKDSLYGEGGADKLYGQNSPDALVGGEGNDLLDGGNGKDILEGDAGNDTLKGDKGNDTLRGGTGADNFDGGRGEHDSCDGGIDSDPDVAKECEVKTNMS